MRRQDIYCWAPDGRLVHHWPSADEASEFFDLTRERIRCTAAKHQVRRGLLFTLGGDNVSDLLLRMLPVAVVSPTEPVYEPVVARPRDWYEGKYGFIWFRSVSGFGDPSGARWVRASSLDAACRIFLSRVPQSAGSVDYEVQYGDEYLDITDRAGQFMEKGLCIV